MAINTTPDSYTKFLVHSDTTNGSTTFVDSSATGHTVLTNGDPSHSTSQAKFGSTAIHCDATADGFGAASHADFDLADNDWTLDFWWYPTSIESENYFLNVVGGWSTLCLYYPSSNGWKVIHSNPGAWQTSVQGGAGTLTANEYQHIAFVRANHYYTIYLDGAIVAGPTQDTRALTNGGAGTLSHSSYMAGNITGYVDEYRLSVGIARWTAAFTPPTKPYTITSPGSIMASNVEDDGSSTTSFGTNIITRSDPDEVASDSAFSVNAKDGTELVNVRADGKTTMNQPIVRYGNSDTTHPGMYRYCYRAFYGHTPASTSTITVLNGYDSAYANMHFIIEAWMAHNNGDNWAYSKWFGWINYQGTGTHARKEIIAESGSGANSIEVTWNGSTYSVAFTTTGGQNGYMSYDVLTSHEDAIIIH